MSQQHPCGAKSPTGRCTRQTEKSKLCFKHKNTNCGFMLSSGIMCGDVAFDYGSYCTAHEDLWIKEEMLREERREDRREEQMAEAEDAHWEQWEARQIAAEES